MQIIEAWLIFKMRQLCKITYRLVVQERRRLDVQVRDYRSLFQFLYSREGVLVAQVEKFDLKRCSNLNVMIRVGLC